MNEQLRVAEASEKEAADLEEETKLKLEEADKQKQEVDEKLVQCLARETRVIDDLQKLKVGMDSPLIYFDQPELIMCCKIITKFLYWTIVIYRS